MFDNYNLDKGVIDHIEVLSLNTVANTGNTTTLIIEDDNSTLDIQKPKEKMTRIHLV